MTKKDWKNIADFFRFVFKRDPKLTLSTILFGVMQIFQPYVLIFMSGYLVDAVYNGQGLRTCITIALVGLGLSTVAGMISDRFEEWFYQRLEYIHEYDSKPLNDKAFSMDYEYLEETQTSELRSRSFSKNFHGMHGTFLWGLTDLVSGVFSMVITVFLVLGLVLQAKEDPQGMWWISIMMILLIGITVFASVLNYRRSVNSANKRKEKRNDLDVEYNKYHFYLDLFSKVESQKDIRMNHQEKLLEKEAQSWFDAIKKGVQTECRMSLKEYSVRMSISNLIGLIICIFIGTMAYAGLLSLGSVITCVAGLTQFAKVMNGVAGYIGSLKYTSLRIQDYLDFMNLEKRKGSGTLSTEELKNGKFRVEFENVSFRYPGTDADVIRNLNLTMEIDERMAIVGKNGSGKTTFIKLLCRLYDVTEGCIKVNGIDIREYDYQEYCKLFSVVFQDFKMFAFQLGENIAANDTPDRQKVLNALKRAGFEGNGEQPAEELLDTYVGKEFNEGGYAFSGGEQQKMAIARAIYKDAPFVIMDEPTAALDPESECEVYAGFDKMVGNKRAVYISHRLASCRFCSDILVFDHGQIVQRGSHEELAAQPGLYRELWDAQAQYYR